jgi:16S rRNA processing protein RimM
LTARSRKTTVGRVGRPHGRDGSFYVEEPSHALAVGTRVTVRGREAVVERRGGTDERPLVRLGGVEEIGRLRGEPLAVPLDEAPLEEGEWLVEDLVGCRVEGLGEVRRVLAGTSCDLLEVGDDAVLVPFVSDAIRRVDPEAGVIEVDREFLGL